MSLFDEEDIVYEEECLRNAYNLKTWLRYIDHKRKSSNEWTRVYLIYERALKQLSGSYKLWYSYLQLRREHLKDKCIDHPDYEDVNDVYERALVYMNKMPRIWTDYCEFLLNQCLNTRTRNACDRALRFLPVTQHNRIWNVYLKLVETFDIPDTGVKVYKRYSKVCFI